MDQKGTIEVTTEFVKGSHGVRLTVSDEGCGIDPDGSSQLFEPYFSTKAGGTGLGLAIVQRIIADHGGTVRATPRVPKGTTFVIEFLIAESSIETKSELDFSFESRDLGSEKSPWC
jgi:two-component system nitrogen regulation sensor histidine kinase NtrY